jgi:hypothetical protein
MENEIVMNPWSHDWDKLTGRRDSVDVRCIGRNSSDVSRKAKQFHRMAEPIVEAYIEKRYHRTRLENRNCNIQKGRRK